MFWAAFRYRMRTELVAMRGDKASARGGVTLRRYIEVLKEHLFTILENDSLFMQDNLRVHIVILVQDWFADRGGALVFWINYLICLI
jgi:hypothetical protein